MAGVADFSVNPIAHSSRWHYIEVGSLVSPGAIPRNGIRGFDRVYRRDQKSGKGTKGATATLTDIPPIKGQIDFQLWTAEHFTQWDVFMLQLQFDPTKRAFDATRAFDIYHPALAKVEFSQALMVSVSPQRHVGRGMYIVTLTLEEWLSPPPKPIVATVTSSSSVESPVGNAAGGAPNPHGARQAEIATLYSKFQQIPPQ